MANACGRLIEFDIRTPCGSETLRAHVAHALGLGLAEIEPQARRRDTLSLIANGPTALDAPLTGVTMACNGALSLFTAKGLAPTWWIACDPQELVADFLRDAPEETTYLVASKCHPAVFERLRGRKVLIWHVDDDGAADLTSPAKVPTATSVTLCAMSVASRLLGFSDIETWGWDGCYRDGRDHAVPQRHVAQTITNLVGRRRFTTTPTWCAEAVDARLQIIGADYRVQVRGRGMFDAILRLKPVAATP